MSRYLRTLEDMDCRHKISQDSPRRNEIKETASTGDANLVIREATGGDADKITSIFHACYGDDYAHRQFYDAELVRRLIYSDDTLVLVAEDTTSAELLGTASVIYNKGAHSDLTGEFGRLAVTPEARNRGVGKLLMAERLARIADRLHVVLIDARLVHPYTLKIAEAQGFAPVGFVPMKTLIGYRESIALLARYSGDALKLRRNHPRISPETYPLAAQALTNCGLEVDVIVDETTLAYPREHEHLEISNMHTEGYSSLLRIERGRVRNREIFGPMRLHYGFFKLRARNSEYLVARQHGHIVGAIGFTIDPIEKAARIFELISLCDETIAMLISEVLRVCREEKSVEFIEVDVSAYAPRMQRTLLEQDFVPVAYVPAVVFHEVERLDAIKMVQLLIPLNLGPLVLSETAEKIADIVMKRFQHHYIAPRIADAVDNVLIFKGFSKEQINRLASSCAFKSFEKGNTIFLQDSPSTEMYFLIKGQATIHVDSQDKPIAIVQGGECLGETAFLTGETHSASAVALCDVDCAVLNRDEFSRLIDARPDIGILLYRNLAIGLGTKLRRADDVLKLS